MISSWINSTFNVTINEEQIEPIKDFTLVWNAFDNFICDCNFSILVIEEKIKNKVDWGNFYDEALIYFQKRYCSKNELNTNFSNFVFRPNDRKDFVGNVLLGKKTSVTEKILALTIIIYRFRNNLFHGIKDIIDLNLQSDNFNIANNFLKNLIVELKQIEG